MIRAVLFDVDGTLMNNNGLHVQAWKEAFKPYKDFDDAELFRYVGMGSDTYIASLAPELDLATREAIRDRKRTLYRVIGAEAAPFPGSKQALTTARAHGLKIALASSANQVEIRRYISELGIAPLLDAVITASDVAKTKPEPDLFLAALAKLDLPASEAFVVGDTPYDVQAASKAGLPTIGVLSGGFSRETLEGAGALRVLQDVGELADRFDEILAQLQPASEGSDSAD